MINQLISRDAPEKEVEFSYDSRGNRIEENDVTNGVITHNDYTVEGQLTRVSEEDANGTTVVQQNAYDADGTRVQKTEGNDVKKYYYAGDDMIITTEGTDTVFTGMYDEDNEIISAFLGASPDLMLYCKDMQGSTSVLADTDFDISGGYSYSDYGEVTGFDGTPDENEICYTGAVYDRTTGEHYLRARYYDPETAVFTAQDTYRGEATDESLWNMYAYCGGDSVNHLDRSGHSVLSVLGDFAPVVNIKKKYAYWKQKSLQSHINYCDLWDSIADYTNFNIKSKKIYIRGSYKKGEPKKKWRIQLWKGQYGTIPFTKLSAFYGGECGIYYEQKLLGHSVGYKCAGQGGYKFRISIRLKDKKEKTLIRRSIYGWWCNFFKVGSYKPSQLLMNASITFHTKEMAKKAKRKFKKILPEEKVKYKKKKVVIHEW